MYIRFQISDLLDLLEILDVPYETKTFYDDDIGFTEIQYTFVIDGMSIRLHEPSFMDFVVTCDSDDVHVLKELADTHQIQYEMKKVYF